MTMIIEEVTDPSNEYYADSVDGAEGARVFKARFVEATSYTSWIDVLKGSVPGLGEPMPSEPSAAILRRHFRPTDDYHGAIIVLTYGRDDGGGTATQGEQDSALLGWELSGAVRDVETQRDHEGKPLRVRLGAERPDKSNEQIGTVRKRVGYYVATKTVVCKADAVPNLTQTLSKTNSNSNYLGIPGERMWLVVGVEPRFTPRLPIRVPTAGKMSFSPARTPQDESGYLVRIVLESAEADDLKNGLDDTVFWRDPETQQIPSKIADNAFIATQNEEGSGWKNYQIPAAIDFGVFDTFGYVVQRRPNHGQFFIDLAATV